MNTWTLTYNKFDPENENLREALCTLGNGYFGTRGATPETTANKVHYPGTYIAGLYNTLPTDIAGNTIYNEDFVNCPNWLMFNYRIGDGPWFNRLKTKLLSWKMELDMKKGVLTRRMRWQDDKGRITKVENQRVVSMANPHVGAIKFNIIPENYSGRITLRSGIDGLIINAGVERYRQLSSKHLEPIERGSIGNDGVFLHMRTNVSQIDIVQAVRHLVFRDGKKIKPSQIKTFNQAKERAIHEITLNVKEGEKVTVDKLMAMYTSRDQGVDDHRAQTIDTVKSIEDFSAVYKPHVAKWKALWHRFDVVIDGDEEIQRILRLHAFHLLQSASPYNEDIDAGIPARGLHGEAYRGHIFWDELYIYPFYTLHAPEITRALLMYRYRRLPKAKEYAREFGYKGAMFPWQSGSTGEEISQIIHLNPMSGEWGEDNSSRQRHVSIAIAYNVWTYYYTSGDRDFIDRYGAEMILEIAQFWSTIARYDQSKKQYVIEGVMGPDEFHEKYPGAKQGGLNNNAYTNVMAVWVIDKALELLNTFNEGDREALMAKCELKQTDLDRWKQVSESMYVPVDKDGLIHQYDGYMDLKELDWDDYRERYENIHRVDRILKAEGKSPDEYKAAKQADVLMLFYVLNYKEIEKIFKRLGHNFSRQIVKKNYDYYIERTSHGSTLSKVVHTYVAQRLKMNDQAMSLYRDALLSDINDTQGGTTQEGIHCGVMAGTLDLALRCYAGLAVLEDRITLNPEMPKHWKSMKFQVRYKNIWFKLAINRKMIMVMAEPLEHISLQAFARIPIEVRKNLYMLEPGKTLKIKL